MEKTMELSTQQEQAIDAILAWHKGGSKTPFVLAGYAGTGKTTLAKYLSNILGGKVYFCAYTGKAVNVLREKGCKNSGTIHGYIYRLIGTTEGNPRFELNHSSELSSASLVIVDEYSMLPADLMDDLESVSSKVLYLGDPFQLPPVNKGNIREMHPDFFLTDVHRQALESPILRAATEVREGRRLEMSREDGFIHLPESEIDEMAIYGVEQIIVGYNKTKRIVDEHFLKYLFGDHRQVNRIPVGGEKVMCLANNKRMGIYNGMIGVAENCRRDNLGDFFIDLECYGSAMKNLRCFEAGFGGGKIPNHIRGKMGIFDYAYAITCHKSQGSEFKSAWIYNQAFGDNQTEKNRWIYTAITRASEKCYLVERG
jgi:exodeoxyribonuclease V